MYHALIYDTYMPQVSKNKLSKKVEEDLCNTLELILSGLTKKDAIKSFLVSFLTPTERIMLAKRLSIVILLRENVPQSQIAQALHVTRVTVARMELFLEARGQGYEVIFNILKKEKAINEIKSMLLDLAAYSARAAGGRVKPGIF